MRIGAEAMNAALTDFAGLQYQSQVASAYEAFLTAKWIEAQGLQLGFNEVNQAVAALFQLLPGDGLGRLSPFRYDWRVSKNSGRMTVWNNNTRGGRKKSATLFVDNDIRNGLVTNAASLLEAMLPTDPGGNPVKPKRQALAVLVLRDHEFSEDTTWSDADNRLKERLACTEAELSAITSSVPLGVSLVGGAQWSPATLPGVLGPQEVVTVQPPGNERSSLLPSEAEDIAVVVDSRVERMLRLALTAYSSILLVGPPGTGKGKLLKWLISQVQRDPEKYGFDVSFHPNPLWRTPDESWTTFELVGGLAPDKSGVLSWASGALLNAIAEDRWLVLDETNRADMDKIMGPLLTWLSKQDVELGTTEVNGGASIHLGWSTGHASEIEQSEKPLAHRYLAGRDWRLLGTYNPQDAQRVFRFGQALSRRFVIVPIPALKPGQFIQLLSSTYDDLPEAAGEAIGALYAAHQTDSDTALGPAVFLGVARYMLAGHTSLPSEQAADTQARLVYAESARTTEDVLPNIAQSPTEAASADAVGEELLAEAYVLGLGRYLAGYDDHVFEALGSRVVDGEGVLSDEQWSWIQSQRKVLSS